MRQYFDSTTRIVIGRTAARPTERAAAYLQSQVEQRTGWRWEIATGDTAAPGSIVVGIAGDGSPAVPLVPEHPEEITLFSSREPAGPAAYAMAGGPSAILAAVGKLARTMDLRPGRACLPALAVRERPAFPVRGHTLANHKQNTTYDKWDWSHWEEYLTELAAWGNNVVILYPLHPARWQGALPFDDPPWFDSPQRQAEYERQMAIQRRLPALCHDLGMRYGVWIPPNDVFPVEVARHPEITRHGGTYVCPSIPAARQRIRAVRERIFAMLSDLDILFIPSKDDGGCPGCERCNPWAPMYRELVEEQAALARTYHPGCKVWLAQQGLTGAETSYLIGWLDRERPDWVEGITFGPYSEVMSFGAADGDGRRFSTERYVRGGPRSGPLSRLRAALPGQYQLILYPDETHVYRCQYPVVGMDPAVQYVWNREDGPAPRPRETAAIHRATSAPADGAIPYSEGNTDDVNKHVWSALGWDPSRAGDDVAGEYARWYFGSGVADEAAEIILATEEILNGPLYGNPAVERGWALTGDCEAREPALLENWRWLNLRLGVGMLYYVQRVLTRDRQLASELRYRAAVWHHDPDPLPHLTATIQHVERRFAETAALLADLVETRDKLFATHRLAVRGVARLQNSYLKLDWLLEQWKALVPRLERGEIPDFPARYAALITPLREAEDSVRLAMRGVEIVPHVQEFPWEAGPTTWA